jgi:hypothetical protein
MHDLVREVVQLKHGGRDQEAEKQFSGVTDAAEDVVALLTNIEGQLSRAALLARGASA